MTLEIGKLLNFKSGEQVGNQSQKWDVTQEYYSVFVHGLVNGSSECPQNVGQW